VIARTPFAGNAWYATRKFSGLMLGFGLSIPVFFVTTYAWLLWIAGPLTAGQRRLRQCRSRSPDRT